MANNDDFIKYDQKVNTGFKASQDFSFYDRAKHGNLKTREENSLDILKYGVQSAIIGFVDTVGTSVGLLDDETIKNTLEETLPGLGTYYRESEEGAKLVGDLAGMAIPGTIGIKALQGAGRIYRGLNQGNKFKLLGSVFTSGKSYNELLRGVKMRDLHALKRGIDPALDQTRKAFTNSATLTKVGDSIKEVTAFELGVFGTMNDSQVLYPDELTVMENFGIAAFVAIPFVGMEAAFMTRQMRASAQQAAQFFAEGGVRDPAKLLNEILARPGMRDISMTVEAHSANVMRSMDQEYILKQTAGFNGSPIKFDSAKEQLNRQILALDVSIQKTAKDIFHDSPITGLTNRATPSNNELETVLNALKKNEGALIGTYSLEHLPPTFKGIEEVFETRKAVSANLAEKIDKAREKSKKLLDKGEDNAEELVKIDALTKKLDLVNGTEFYIIEPSGNIVNAAMRKPIYQDGPQAIQKKGRTISSPAIFEVHTRGDDLFQTPDKLLGVTEDFHLVIPQDKTLKVSGINVTKVMKPEELSRVINDQDYSLLLKDIGEDWHFKTGKRGSEVFNELPENIQEQIREWTRQSARSDLRKWSAEGDPRYNQIVNAYKEAGLHKRLAELADADGTIPLFRGEKAYKPGDNIENDIVSFTSHPRKAGDFSGTGKQVIEKRVHIDDIVMVVGGLKNEWEYIVKGNKLRTIGETVTRRDWAALTLQERSAAYAGLQSATENYKPGAFGGNRNVVFTGDHHTRIDAFLQLHEKHGDAVFKDFILGKGATVEDLTYASLEGKFKDFVGISKLRDGYKSGVLKIPENKRLNQEDVRKMLNLPESNYGETTPLLDFFEEIYRQGDVSLTESFKTLDAFYKGMQNSITFPERIPYLKTGAPRSYGDMMNYSRTARPVMAVKRPVSGFSYNRDYVVENLGLMRADAMSKFENSNAAGAQLVQTFFDLAKAQPELIAEAIRVQSLTQAGVRGSGAVSQQAFAAGEQPTIQAMHNLAVRVDREFRIKVGQIFEQHAPAFQAIKHPNNKADMVSFNTFTHARRMGWDLEDEVAAATRSGGSNQPFYQFKLKDTKFNRERWEGLFGTKMPEEAMMPNTVGAKGGRGLQPKPLTITQLAFENVKAFSSLGHDIMNNSNHVNNIMGKPQRTPKEWWVPPKNLSKEHTAFLVDDAGQLHSTVNGRSPSESLRKARQAQAESEIPLKYVTRTDLGRWFQLRDEALERMADFSDIGLQTGRAKGTSVTPEIVEIGSDIFNDMVKSVESGFESILRRSRAAYFEPQIKMAYKMHQFAGLEEASAKGQTIWQRYLAEIFDNPTLNPNDMIGQTYFGIENIWDDMAQAALDKKMSVTNPTGLKKIKANRQFNDTYAALEKQMGDFNPFGDAVDFMNKTYKQPIPANMKPTMVKLGNGTTLLKLRMLEVGHSVLTFISLGATIPGVVKSMSRMAGEDGLAFGNRIGAFGIKVSDDTAMFSPTRAITSTMHEIWQPEFRAAMGRAGDKGLFDQQVSEAMKTMTAPAESYSGGMYRTLTDKLSKLSDKSEQLARYFSFATGYNIGKKALKMENEEALFTFANHFANQVIGDYSPNNKPRMFQGAAGMPVGLFMTFMWNYYQRIFSYIENKQLGALAVQYATQAAVFGSQTVPGFDLYANTLLSNYDGTINPVDGLTKRLGPEAAEWILYGSISNIPKLLGMDDGIALYTRGDVNFRNIPTIFTPSDLPTFAMGRDAFNAVTETFKQIRERDGFSPYQFSEIVQSYSTNRFLRSVASFATGHTTDRRGQVISQSPTIGDLINGDIQDYYKAFTRMTGFRTMNEARTVEAHYKIKSGEMSRRYRMDALRDTLRSDARAGNLTGESLMNSVSNYVRYGGRPENFANFVASQYIAGTVDKNAREIIRLMGDDRRAQDVQRLINVLVPGEYQ